MAMFSRYQKTTPQRVVQPDTATSDNTQRVAVKPIANALRVYAAEMRDKRVQRAEEKANKLSTKCRWPQCF